MRPMSAVWPWSSPVCGISVIEDRHPLNFDSLELHPALARMLHAQGLDRPTPIQAQALPPALQGRDVWGSAPTGSGKTLAYALPLLQHQLAHPRQTNFRRPLRSLVLVPTRELAAQVGAVMAPMAQALGLKLGVVHGGVSINPQMMALRGGADLLVATPGRLLDLLEQRALQLSAVQQLVIDEADRLLDDGFAEELQAVLQALPARRQTLLFSATFDDPSGVAARSGLHEAVRVSVSDRPEQAPPIEQHALALDAAHRTTWLRQWLAQRRPARVLVFVATRHGCDHVASKLAQAGMAAVPFHGEMSQGARQEVLDAFRAGQWPVMVTTDLAARGIDIARLPAVVNYDLPRSATDYTHRIGRTGRAGVPGEAWSLVTASSRAHWALICQRNGLDLTLEQWPGLEPRDPVPAPAPGHGGVKGRRPSKKDKLRAERARAAQDPSTSPRD